MTISRFASAQTSQTGAINTTVDTANQGNTSTVTSTAAATITLTGAQTVNGLVLTVGGSTCTVTTATAALIVAALANCQAQSSFDLWVMNTNSGTTTVAAGSGVTLVGTAATIATNKSQLYKGYVVTATSGAEAVSLYAALFAVT